MIGKIILGLGMATLAGALCYTATVLAQKKTVAKLTPALRKAVRFSNIQVPSAPKSATMPTLTPFSTRYL